MEPYSAAGGTPGGPHEDDQDAGARGTGTSAGTPVPSGARSTAGPSSDGDGGLLLPQRFRSTHRSSVPSAGAVFPEPEQDDDMWTGSWARPLYPPPDDTDTPTTLPSRTARPRTAPDAEGAPDRTGGPSRSEATGYDIPLLPTVRRPRRPPAPHGPSPAPPTTPPTPSRLAPSQRATDHHATHLPYDPTAADTSRAADPAALRQPPPAYPAAPVPGGSGQRPVQPPPARSRVSQRETSWPGVARPGQPHDIPPSGVDQPRTPQLPPPLSATPPPPSAPVVRTPAAPQPWTAPDTTDHAGATATPGHSATPGPSPVRTDTSAQPDGVVPSPALPDPPRRPDRWAGLRPPGPSLAEAAERAAPSLWTPHVPVRQPEPRPGWVGGADENDALNPFGGGASREALPTLGWETPDPLGPTPAPAPEPSLPPTPGASSGVFEELQLLRPYDPSGAQPWRAEDGYPPDWPYRHTSEAADTPAAPHSDGAHPASPGPASPGADGAGPHGPGSEDTGLDWTALGPTDPEHTGPELPVGRTRPQISGPQPLAAPAAYGTGSLGQDGVAGRPTPPTPPTGTTGHPDATAHTGGDNGLSAWDRLRRSPTIDGSDPGIPAPHRASGRPGTLPPRPPGTSSSSPSLPMRPPAFPGADNPDTTSAGPLAPGPSQAARGPRRLPSFSGTPGTADPDTFSDLSAPVPMPRGRAARADHRA